MSKRKYSIKNTNCFKKIDSSDKAYWLGYLYADGNINKDKRTTSLASKDIEVLEKFKNFLGSNNKIYRFQYDTTCWYSVYICDKCFTTNLINQGLHPSKSFTIKFPKLPKKMIRHFIRGYFDGDGSIYKYSSPQAKGRGGELVFTCGSKNFLEVLAKILTTELDIYTALRKYESKNYYYQLKIHSFVGLEKIYKYFYRQANVYLERKYKSFRSVLASKESKLVDTQQLKDRRGIGINRVGVEGIDFPLLVATKDGREVLVYAKIDLYSSLKHSIKGTNMSRYIEVLMKYRYNVMNKQNLKHFLISLKRTLGEDVKDVYVKINFKYFKKKISPVSKKESVMAYNCSLEGKLSTKYTFKTTVKVLTTSNCPCSREISKFGAHGQRSLATVTVEPIPKKEVWLDDLIKLVERQGSCEIYPLLKRPDEKYVTERAYLNPKFCEDIARDIALSLQQLETIRWFKIKICNEESIHTHNAVSYVERVKKGKRWRKYSGSLRKIT